MTWPEKLKLAEESGGVFLSETDCHLLRQYITEGQKAIDRLAEVDKLAARLSEHFKKVTPGSAPP